MEYRRDDGASIQRLPGTLIHNGKRCTTAAVGSLPVSLVQPAFRSFSVAEVRSSTLLSAGFSAAPLTAILLAMITAAADPEDGVTFFPAAKPLTENIFGIVSHSHLKARLDNACRSCQLNDGCLEPSQPRGIANGPRSRTRSGSPLAQPSARNYTIIGMMSFAPVAR
jgi:hypothetical protein